MIETYIATSVIDVIALLYLVGLLHSNNVLAYHRKKPFFYGIILTVIVISAEIGTTIANAGSVEMRYLNIICNVLGFALTPLIPIVLIAIFDIRILKNHLILIIHSVINILISIISPFSGLYYFIDENNQYSRGEMFFIFVAVYIVNILLLLISTLRTGKMHFYPIKWKMIFLFVFIVAGTCIQLLYPLVYASWHCVTLALFLYYILLSEFDGCFDTLTELYNRAAFEKASKLLTFGKKFYVVVMDINCFKDINDTYGHEYGDDVLKKVAAIIRESFDNNCSCYRIGGDEFYVICRDTEQEKLELQLRNMTAKLAEERQNDRHLPTIAYGYGICEGDIPPDMQKILKLADDQMYSYKKIQKNCEAKL